MKKNYKAEEGLTLIEIMVVLAVIGIISTAIYNVQLTGFKTFKFNQDRINLNQEARIAMLKMSKKIKEAVEVEDDFDTSDEANHIVVKWEESDNSVHFTKYWIENYKLYYNKVSAAEIKNSDPTFDPDIEWPDWTSITGRQPITTEVAEDITFYAEHRNGNGLVDLVKVELKLDLTPEGDNEADYKLTNQFFVRNAK